MGIYHNDEFGWLSEIVDSAVIGWISGFYDPDNVDLTTDVVTVPVDPERVRNRFGGIVDWCKGVSSAVSVLDSHEEWPHRDSCATVLEEMSSGAGRAADWIPRLETARQVLDELEEDSYRDKLDAILYDLCPYTVPEDGAVARVRAEVAWDWDNLHDSFVTVKDGDSWVKQIEVIADSVLQAFDAYLGERFDAGRVSRLAYTYCGDPNDECDGVIVEIHSDLTFSPALLETERSGYKPAPTSVPNPNYRPEPAI